MATLELTSRGRKAVSTVADTVTGWIGDGSQKLVLYVPDTSDDTLYGPVMDVLVRKGVEPHRMTKLTARVRFPDPPELPRITKPTLDTLVRTIQDYRGALHVLFDDAATEGKHLAYVSEVLRYLGIPPERRKTTALVDVSRGGVTDSSYLQLFHGDDKDQMDDRARLLIEQGKLPRYPLVRISPERFNRRYLELYRVLDIENMDGMPPYERMGKVINPPWTFSIGPFEIRVRPRLPIF